MPHRDKHRDNKRKRKQHKRVQLSVLVNMKGLLFSIQYAYNATFFQRHDLDNILSVSKFVRRNLITTLYRNHRYSLEFMKQVVKMCQDTRAALTSIDCWIPKFDSRLWLNFPNLT